SPRDIYTLFVASRIINFLKGLGLSASTDLDALIDRSWPEDRTRIGFELLRLFRETNRLYFWTSKGLRENEKFESEIFFPRTSAGGNNWLPKWPKHRCWRLFRFGYETIESADGACAG